MRQVMNKMGAKAIQNTYGQTESSPAITQTRTDDPLELKVRTVGKPHPNVEVKITIPGTKEEQITGEPGELCTRGYHVMKGYYNNHEATEEVKDKDGWLHNVGCAYMTDMG